MGQLGIFNDMAPRLVRGLIWRSLRVAAGVVGVLAWSAPTGLAQGDPLFLTRVWDIEGNCADVAVADVTGDGWPDVIAADQSYHKVKILVGDGAFGFGPMLEFPLDLTAGNSPKSIAVGDLDGDGDPDIAAGSSTSGGNVKILLGDGRGDFSVSGSFAVGLTPQGLTIGELNGDGIPDLALVSGVLDAATVLFGDGFGGFGGVTAHAVGEDPRRLALGDLNGDGATDLIAGSYDGPGMAVLLGDGIGGLSAAAFHGSGTNYRDVAAADLDEDGWLDVVAARGSALELFMNDGLGGLEAPTTVPTEPEISTHISVADLDGDGHLDMVLAGADSGSMLGDGRGGFVPTPTFHAGAANAVLADLDLDGVLDLVIEAGSAIGVVRGVGDGTFHAPTDWPGEDEISNLAAADLDADGFVDLVVAHRYGPGVSVLSGDGAGAFPLSATYGDDWWVYDVDSADFNEDGWLDLAVARHVTGLEDAVAILVNDGAGSLVWTGDAPVHEGPTDIAVADLNDDGHTDLIVANTGSDDFIIRFGDGMGGFPIKRTHITGGGPCSVAPGDLNNDGRLDLVVANVYTEYVNTYLASGSPGNLAFLYALEGQQGTNDATLGDLDEDGNLDLVITGSGWTVRRLGDGSGLFWSPDHYFDVSSVGDTALVDLNVDGHLDLAVVHGQSGTVDVLFGDGEGVFSAATSHLVGSLPGSIVVGDLNGDGKPDLAVGNHDSEDVSVLLNHGVWADIGHGLPGSAGAPRLVATGELEPGTAGALTLSGAAASAAAVVFGALTSSPSPFKGGVLVPVPAFLVLSLNTDPGGGVVLAWASWPGDIAPGTKLYLQFAVADTGAVAGVALSNALTADVP